MEKKFTKIKKDESDLNDLNWFEVKNSKFTVWHRPKTSQIPLLKEKFGLTCLITLQSERENLKEIELMCKKIRIDWLHIPLEGANLPLLRRKETKTIIINGLIKSIELLNALENQTLFIHCAAGVHRTGIFTYSLLRLMGFVTFFYFFFNFSIENEFSQLKHQSLIY